MRLALFEPDIPQNTGNMLRTAACLGVAVDLIEPLGFVFGDSRMRRAGMDYLDRVEVRRHASWDAFRADLATRGGRLLLLTTGAQLTYWEFRFRADDVLLVGRESSGVPEKVAAAATERLRIPVAPGIRSLNVAVAAAIALAEALRQTGGFPGPQAGFRA